MLGEASSLKKEKGDQKARDPEVNELRQVHHMTLEREGRGRGLVKMDAERGIF